MAYRRIQNDIVSQDGKAYNDGTGQYKWYNSNGDEAITVGEFIIFRTTLNVPKGALIDSAVFETEYIVKDGNAIPQSFSYNSWMEINAAPYPTVNDTYLGAVGTFPPYPRQRTNVTVAGTLNYTVNTPDADSLLITLTACVQEIVDRPDYVQGDMVSVIINPTAESGDISLRMRNHAFASPHPNLQVYYRENFSTDERVDVNLIGDSTADYPTDGDVIWHTNEAFGFYVPVQTLSRSTEQIFRGTHSWKMTGGPADGTKRFGVMGTFVASPNTSYVFCGWVYVPSSMPYNVHPGFQYVTGGPEISEKDKWVPFCSNPFTTGGDPTTLWPNIASVGPSDPSYHFYFDEVTVVESKHRVLPFNGKTPDNALATYEDSEAGIRDQSRRITRARTQAFTTPLKILDNMDAVTGWSQTTTNAVTATYALSGDGGVTVTLPATGGPITTENIKFTKTMPRAKRFLAVHRVGVPITLSKVTRTNGPDIINPLVVATDGNRDFYDIGDLHGDTTSLEWTVAVNNAVRSFTVYDVGEFEFPANSQALRPARKLYRRSDGIWVQSDPMRQSATWDELESKGITWDSLKASGKTWDELEADATI